MFLLSTSDGDRGAKTVLQIAYNRMSHGNPYKIPTKTNNFHSVLTKLCKFDQLDMLCLNCDESSIITN